MRMGVRDRHSPEWLRSARTDGDAGASTAAWIRRDLPTGAAPVTRRDVLRGQRERRPTIDDRFVANPHPAQHRRAIRIEPPAYEFPAGFAGRRGEAGPSEFRFRPGWRRRRPALGLVLLSGAAIVARRIGAVEIGGQGRAGGEKQGAEAGADEETTSGHGGLGLIGRAGIAAIVPGDCAGLPEPPPCGDVGCRSAG
jgi:hypothetical protein